MKFLATLLLFISLNANAGLVATLLLKGTVPRLLDISISPATIATTLPLDTTQTDTNVATVTEKSNSNTGYKVTLSSANAGKLLRVGGTETINYTLKYNNVAVNLASTAIVTNVGSPGHVNVSKPVDISYVGTPHTDLVEGDYQDTLTFTIAAN